MKLLIVSTVAVVFILHTKVTSALPPQYRAIPFDDIQILQYPQTIPDDDVPTFVLHKVPLSAIHHRIVRRSAKKYMEEPRYIDLTRYTDAAKYADAQSRYIAAPKYISAPKYIAEPKVTESVDKSVEDEDAEAADSRRQQRQASDYGHGGDYVDYGAYTGGYGAFGWYTDHPVHHGHR